MHHLLATATCVITAMTAVSLLPSPCVAQPVTPPRGGVIIQFVKSFDGGDCFFVAIASVTEMTATLDGYGSSLLPFERLDYEFKHQFGFEARIRVHQVAPTQCAVVNDMRNKRGSTAQ